MCQEDPAALQVTLPPAAEAEAEAAPVAKLAAGEDEDEADLQVAVVDDELAVERAAEAKGVYWGLVQMSFWIGFNHGAISAGLKLASTVLGTDLGGDGNGTLCLVYTGTALFLSGPIVQYLGEKWSLVAGLFTYSAYLAAFLVSLYCDYRDDPEAEDPAMCSRAGFLTGSAIGGFAAGFYFTAQDAYFATCTTRYAELTGKDEKSVSSHFSGIVAAIYLLFDLLLKLFSYMILQTTGARKAQTTLFIVLTSVAVATSVGMMTIPKLRETPKALPSVRRGLETLKMMVTDPIILFFTPFDFTFGLITSFIGNIVNARVVKVYLGSQYVPLISAFTSGFAAIGSYPFDFLTRMVKSKLPGLVIGSCLFLAESIVYMKCEPSELGTWAIMMILVVVAGFSRAVFEGPRKAIIADAYTKYSERSCAFSALVVHDGISASVGFYYFPDWIDSLEVNGLSWINIGFSIAAIICSFGVVYFANRRIADEQAKQQQEEQEQELEDVVKNSPFETNEPVGVDVSEAK